MNRPMLNGAMAGLVIAGVACVGLQQADDVSNHPAPQQETALPAELERVLRDYERAWRAHDADGLANLFTEDGFILPNQNAHARGREAIRAAYADSGGVQHPTFT